MSAQSKLNNEAILTDQLRLRLNALYERRIKTKEENEKIKKIDPNMFCYITDQDEQYIQMAEQIVYKNINGTCVKDNCDLYFELEKQGKKPMLMKMEYINKMTKNEAFHVFNIIKINELYYVRDRSNFIDECKELGWWFLDRASSSTPTNLYRATATHEGNTTHMVFHHFSKGTKQMLTLNDEVINRKRAFKVLKAKKKYIKNFKLASC